VQLVRYLDSVDAANHEPSVVTIGNFDALHLGHQKLIAEVCQQASAQALQSIMLTFDPLPEEVFKPQDSSARVLSLREKWRLLSHYPLDLVCCVPFSKVFAQLSAKQFVKDILVDTLNVKKLIVGEDFRFGQKRQGDIALLETLGKQFGFTVQIEKVMYRDRVISSTWIRSALKDGDFDLAEKLLGRPYSNVGRVVYGNQLGRKLGCPTANIPSHRKTSALHGVYIADVLGLDGKVWPAIASMGTRPAVQGEVFLLEVHLFDFDREIYGQLIEVRYREKLRDEWMFDSIDELKIQIHKDCQQAKLFYESEQ
jgi:riboflavin kinase / FMN adenylyltransferase